MRGTNGSYSDGILKSDSIEGDAITSNTNGHGLKLYEAIMFSAPIVFTFIVLFLFYLIYLRRQSVDWSSLRMRASSVANSHNIGVVEVGLKKEFREMLPIIIYMESFSAKDTQCPVCLGDYQAEDKLQQIPGCGHTFHLNCINNWLTTHTTCPLCRLSLISSSETPQASEPNSNDNSESGNDFLQHHRLQV